jgi:gliding motility-associated-like protein
LNDIQGSSAVNTITFESESGDSTAVMIRYEVDQSYLVNLKEVEHVNFRKLGFKGFYSLMINESSSNINVEHCYFYGWNWSVGVISGSQDVTIKNNLFYGGSNAVVIQGDATFNTRQINVVSNIFQGQGGNSTYITWSKDVTVKDNLYDGHANPNIYASTTRNTVIDGNRLINCSVAIRPDNSRGLIIRNNRISLYPIPSRENIAIRPESNDTAIIYNNYIHSEGTVAGTGILSNNNYHTGIYFNSVDIANTDVSQDSKALIVYNNGLQTDIRNNIFNVETGGYPVYIAGMPLTATMDYNDYYHPDGIIGFYAGVTYYSLSDWGQAINGDANSKTVNPFYASVENPLPYQRELNGAGIPVSGVLLDINGKIRNDQAPDIGCVEFTVDFGVTDMLSPNLDCVHASLEDVTVYLRQFGDIPFIDLKLAYQVNGGDIQYDTIPGTIFNDLLYTFDTPVNITTDGEYNFKIWLINALDDNINNDTLYTTRYSKPAPQLTTSFDNQCTWNEVTFSGSASIAAPYFIESYEWQFGDSTISFEQNPVHIYENPGYYAVVFRAYSNAGCYSDDTLDVFVDPAYQVLDVSLDITAEVCKGDGTGTVVIQAAGGTPPYTYFMDDQPLPGNQVTGITPGEYLFKVTDSQQCEASESATINPSIYMSPVISALPDSGFAPMDVQFAFEGFGVSTCTWDFGDSQSSTEFSPVHTFNDYGEHTIVLTVNSGEPYFCQETDTITIFTDVNIIINANSVFTPNGDGLNDYFEVRTNGIRDLNVKIYDAWGDFIYEITSVEGKWDGKTKGGKEAPEGVYFYYVTATAFNESNFERTGSVMLLRDDSEIYPNPVSGMMKLKPGGLLSGEIWIEIFNIQGVQVYSKVEMDSGEIEIDLSNLKDGFYILRACDGEDCIYKRVIKN